MKTLASKKGMTLVEVIVGALVFSIIAATISLVLAPTLRAYMKANELAEINTLLDNLSAELVNDISRAGSARFSGSEAVIATDTGTITYSIGTEDPNKGLLMRETMPVLERGYYKGKTLSLQFYDGDGYDFVAHNGRLLKNTDAPHEIVVKLTVQNDTNTLASREYAVRPLGFNQYEGSR